MNTAAAKFAAPFKAPCLTNSSQMSTGSQPPRARIRCRGELQGRLAPSGDHQLNQKRRCKDILSGLSQDSNISTQTFNSPTVSSQVATQSTTKSDILLSNAHKVIHKENALDATAVEVLQLDQLMVVARKIEKYNKIKPAALNTVNDIGAIQTCNKEVEAKQKVDALLLPTSAHYRTCHNANGADQTRTVKSTADTNLKRPDVYEFFMSPTSLRKQRKRIRKLQARDRMKRKLLELISKMHCEMQELRERNKARATARHKGTDKQCKVLQNKTSNRRKSSAYSLVQANTARRTISINKTYVMKPSGSVQSERPGYADRGRGDKRLTAVEQ